jgi:superfamily II DNA or RNA helicase
VPEDPPRCSAFYCYRRPYTHGISGAPSEPDGTTFDHQLEVVLPAGASVRRRVVSAHRLSVADALSVLRNAELEGGSPSALGWSRALTIGLVLLSRGRLFPAVSPDGYDAWSAGPLDLADRLLLAELATALPPEAHAVAVPGSVPLAVASPQHLVRALWDALADTLVRTQAAETVAGSPLFAATDPQPASELREWLDDVSVGFDGGADVALRVEIGPAPELARAVVQLSSRVDPSLVVDAGTIFTAPPTLVSRFGDNVEADLLRALRRGARAWPPLDALLHQRAPEALELREDELADLLGEAATLLAGAGLPVLWPAGMVTDGVRLQASMTSQRGKVEGTAGFDLASLVTFRWQAMLDGQALTEEEIDILAEAKRGLVRLRGRFVVADPELIKRLRERRQRKLSAIEALAGALSGSIEIDGERFEVAVGGALAELVARLSAADGAGGVGVGEDDPPPAGLMADLRPYQRRGVAWLRTMTAMGLGGCLADDMGLGKTLQVIALHLHRMNAGAAGLSTTKTSKTKNTNRHAPAGPTLVICPTSLLGNWEREVRRFAPDVPVRRHHGAGRQLDDLEPNEIVVTSYGVVRREAEELSAAGFALVVADEAQHAKNPDTATARALRHIDAPARLALTGTPVENRLSDLWALLDWTTPGLLGPLERFVKSVATPIERYQDPVTTERLARTVRPFLLRRRKTDPEVAPDLPARMVTDVAVPLTAEQVQLYEAEVREALAAIEGKDGIERQGLVLRLLTVLKQICNHPAQYLHQSGPLAGRSGKLAALEELVPVIVDEGDSVLVFSQFVECLALIEARLEHLGIATRFLHGKVPARRRSSMVDEFQAGVVPVFLLSLKVGGVGLNLTRATHVVHYDRWWNPATEDQATDRAHRIGQDRPVQVHRLIAEGTLEDRIAELIEKKRALAESVVGGGEAWIGRLSDADLADLVTLGSGR